MQCCWLKFRFSQRKTGLSTNRTNRTSYLFFKNRKTKEQKGSVFFFKIGKKVTKYRCMLQAQFRKERCRDQIKPNLQDFKYSQQAM